MDLRRIERLPDDLVNKIAAGEVVERPASVVKELVENALDAGASVVKVEVEAGGKSLVRVRDDGHGMGREDAARALERHATSKLRELSDLERVATHGFRGEALPSIASVSHLLLRTCEAGAPAGTEVDVRHGRLVHVRDAGHPRGTTIEVRDLFGEVPARRKFLRADGTEASHVAEAATLLALARPEVGFFLSSSGRSLLQAPPVEGLFARVHQVFGGAYADLLVPVEWREAWAGVCGFVRPPTPAAGRASLRLFVNGRPVRDRAVSRAVTEAYRATGLRDPRPEVLLFLDVPLHMVDVNVHPAKTEVRFAEPRTVWAAVVRAVREGLGVGARRGPAGSSFERGEASREGGPVPGVAWTGAPAGGGAAVAEAAAAVVDGPGPSPVLLDSAPPTVLGQHRNTYILATDGEDLLLVDQHTAHERVRFEAVMDGLEGRSVESQMMLVPMVLTLPPRLRPGLEAHRESLEALGFDVEPFGGDSVRVSAVPRVLGGRDPGAALASLLSELLDRESAEWTVTTARERLAATLACHSAVRGGQPLAAEPMRAIVGGLWGARQPAFCPHGRPTRVRIPREDVSRWFRRTGWRRD
ncbi:MAG TPA: DNA mismatch repair endonuclease MutL [Vicinamibacteria bacterium]|nr:DNA mismatch repair endonuclease MutL [Vicinamibacteria bacterium]